MIMIICLNEQHMSMFRFFIDTNVNKKQRNCNTINKPSMIDVPFKNTRKFTDILFLESGELARY